MASSPLRPHRYTIDVRNRASASVRVSITSEGCDWLSIEYAPRKQLALGMSMRIFLRAPTHMPLDSVLAPQSTGSGVGAGVEKVGWVGIEMTNVWTYQVGQSNTQAANGEAEAATH